MSCIQQVGLGEKTLFVFCNIQWHPKFCIGVSFLLGKGIDFGVLFLGPCLATENAPLSSSQPKHLQLSAVSILYHLFP